MTEFYGQVELHIVNITSYAPDNSIGHNTSPTVDHCFTPPTSGPDLDFCNGSDADGDGVCGNIDPDFGD